MPRSSFQGMLCLKRVRCPPRVGEYADEANGQGAQYLTNE